MARRKTITLAPDALDRNGITTAETLVAARLALLINGALSAGYDRNGLATSQTPLSAAALTLDGVIGTDLAVNGRKGAYVIIYAAADDTGRTFTVVGTDGNGSVLTEAITGPGLGLIVMSANKFYTIDSVTPDAATAGAIEVGTNGYYDISQAQHIAVYSAGDDTGDTFTVTGEDRYKNALTEALTGSNAGTTAGTKNFGRVERIESSGASTGAVEAGVDGTCESQWFILNYRGNDFNVGLAGEISTGGAMTWDIQHTFDDLFIAPFVEGAATVFTHDTLASETDNQNGNYTNPPAATRSAITAHTSGSLEYHIIQSGSGS
jgi:VCBS repeat-containing protein